MFRLTCILIALVTGVYGITYMLFPGPASALYLSTEVQPGTLLMGRYFGVTLLFIAVACWLVKDVVDPIVRNAISTAGLVNCVTGLVVSVVFTVNGLMTIFGWSAVAIYLVGMALWLLARKQDSNPAPA